MNSPPQNRPDLHVVERGNGVGNQIRAARKKAGLSLEQLAQSTRIASRNLRYLEEETFELLPARVFVRGYLKAISKELDADPEPLIEAFESQTSDLSQESNVKVNSIEPSSPNVSFKTGHVLAVLLAILGFFLVYFAVEGGKSTNQSGTLQNGQSTVVTPDTRPIHPR